MQIGVTKTEGGLTPFDDYFIVRFEPADTSGGGDVMIWLGKAAAKVMEEAILATVPFRVDIEIGPNWGELTKVE